jgi:hypothetical protein
LVTYSHTTTITTVTMCVQKMGERQIQFWNASLLKASLFIFALMVHSRKKRAHIHMWKTNIFFWRKEKTSGDTSLLNITKLSLELIITFDKQCVQFFYDMNSYCIYQSDRHTTLREKLFRNFYGISKFFPLRHFKNISSSLFHPHFYDPFISSSCKNVRTCINTNPCLKHLLK